MLNTIVVSSIAFVFPLVVFLATIFLSLNNNLDREKTSPFECGFDPNSSARTPFSLRFFLLAVIFLVFDIEIVLLMPIPSSVYHNLNSMTIGIFIFLLILIIGLLHEWREGSLNWQT